jgi:site-specific DNA recombinase
VPFGYRRHALIDEHGQVILNHKGRIKDKIDSIYEPEAAVVRFAVEQVLAGRSIRSITFEIERGPIRPRNGGSWDVRHVRRMVTMPTYAGLRIYNGKILGDASWPAIITKAQHERALAIFANPSRKVSYMGRAPRWLLSGIAHCGKCGEGSRIAVQHDNRPQRNAQSVYQCVRQDAEHPGCFGAVNLAEAEALVAMAIKRKMTEAKLGAPTDDVALVIDAKHAEVDRIDAELAEISADKDLTYGEIKAMGVVRRDKIKAIKDEISALLPQVTAAFEVPWDEADLMERRRMIETYAKSIALTPGPRTPGRKRVFTPDQIQIKWNGES